MLDERDKVRCGLELMSEAFRPRPNPKIRCTATPFPLRCSELNMAMSEGCLRGIHACA
jgi:hypothetical protein